MSAEHVESARKPRIAFVSQPFTAVIPPVRHADSISIWTYEVALRLAPYFDSVVCSRRAAGQAPHEIDEGTRIEFRRVRTPSVSRARRLAELLRLPVGDKAEQYADYAYALAVALAVRRMKADVVHIQNFSQFVPLFRRIVPNARIVLHMHCEWLSQHDELAVKRRLAAVDRVVACSGYIARLAQARFPQYAERIRVLYNGVDSASFGAGPVSAGESPPHALFVGRVTPEKGLHDLLDAFEQVLAEVPRARLSIVGPPWTTPKPYIVDVSEDPKVQTLDRFYASGQGYLEQLKARMSARLRAAVDFVGPVPRQDLAQRYQAAALLVNPSLSESFGMSLIEAHSCSRPVVATAVGGMQELVRDGESGLLVPPANPAALAGALVKLLDNPALRDQMGRVGLRDSVRFGWDRIAQDAHAHYREVLAGG